MEYKKNRRKHTNKKIRGDLTCFKNTEFENKAKRLANGPLLEDDLIEFRNLGKDIFGRRMHYAAKKSGIFAYITQETQTIVLEYLKTISDVPNAYKFADCFFDSYNGDNYVIDINTPKCTTTNKKKAFKHAVKDCLKAFDTYFTPIHKRMRQTSSEKICEKSIIGKYNDIKFSLSFMIHFLYQLHCGSMPTFISKSVYENALNYDLKIASHYEFIASSNQYVLNSQKNNMLSAISQECAAYLICNKHK